MYSSIKYKTGDAEALANEFFELLHNRMVLKRVPISIPEFLDKNNILAVRFTSDGGQGDVGGVELLYLDDDGIKVLYGNFCYGNLNLNALLHKLPMLRSIYNPRSPNLPYPFGGELDLPSGWVHIYMRFMNYFFVREEICEKADSFIREILNSDNGLFLIFTAVAWFCGAEFESKK